MATSVTMLFIIKEMLKYSGIELYFLVILRCHSERSRIYDKYSEYPLASLRVTTSLASGHKCTETLKVLRVLGFNQFLFSCSQMFRFAQHDTTEVQTPNLCHPDR